MDLAKKTFTNIETHIFKSIILDCLKPPNLGLAGLKDTSL